MSIRKLVEKYPEIFSKEKYNYIWKQDAGDPGVSMEYYVEEIIGLDYDDYLGKHQLTDEEERKLKDYTLLDEIREKGWVK